MKSLAISLGHNASAVLIEDGRVVAGYEEERFSGLKADSHFPILSIQELKARHRLPKDVDCYVGHWFLDAQLPAPNKYWRPNILREYFPDGQVESLSADFTHHDSHLASAMVFAQDRFRNNSYTAVVADGFGSFGECLSIYNVVGNKWRLIKRAWGFHKSLGMLYQYATAFMGMKMHNHEYKMLAYEVHAVNVLTYQQIEILNELVLERAKEYLKEIHKTSLASKFDPITSLEALPELQMHINRMLTDVLFKTGVSMSDQHAMRVATSYFVQRVVESTMTTLLDLYCSQGSLLVVGGLFYNVKLNHLLAQQTKGTFCAMPLAGDQGAALGVYQMHQGDLIWPGHLNWGDRSLFFDESDLPKGVVLVDDEEQAEAVMASELRSKGFVNLVRGKMEYGPRSLCNTSTIGIPDRHVAMNINRMNDRTMEMPFAPVVTAEQADDLFVDCHKIHKSLEYMIVTRTYKHGKGETMPGAAHWYPLDGVHTGRPQITSDPMMLNLLAGFGPLINTSFNYHGVPIVRSSEQILDTHVREWKAAPDLKPTTVIIRSI